MNQTPGEPVNLKMKKQSVYRTNVLKGYVFPTHRTDLIIDRAESEVTEVFIVVLGPAQKTPLHEHDDCEQLWHVIEGRGRVKIGPRDNLEEHIVGPGDVVLVRRSFWHSMENCGDRELRYLAVDVFVGERQADEPTWDAHIEAFCRKSQFGFERVHVENGAIVGTVRED